MILLLALAGGVAGCVAYQRLTDDLPDLSASTDTRERSAALKALEDLRLRWLSEH